jgi:hypothetical protein
MVDMKYEFNLSIFNIQVLSFFGQILCLLITCCGLFLYYFMVELVRMWLYSRIKSRRVGGTQGTILLVCFYLSCAATPVRHECMYEEDEEEEKEEGKLGYGSFRQTAAFETNMQTGHMQEHAADRLSPVSNHVISVDGNAEAFIVGAVGGAIFQGVLQVNPVTGIMAGGLSNVGVNMTHHGLNNANEPLSPENRAEIEYTFDNNLE